MELEWTLGDGDRVVRSSNSGRLEEDTHTFNG